MTKTPTDDRTPYGGTNMTEREAIRCLAEAVGHIAARCHEALGTTLAADLIKECDRIRVAMGLE